MSKMVVVKDFIEKKVNNQALKMAKKSVNSTCSWLIHQPKLTEEVKKALKC